MPAHVKQVAEVLGIEQRDGKLVRRVRFSDGSEAEQIGRVTVEGEITRVDGAVESSQITDVKVVPT
jgi:hypothetical protein